MRRAEMFEPDTKHPGHCAACGELEGHHDEAMKARPEIDAEDWQQTIDRSCDDDLARRRFG